MSDIVERGKAFRAAIAAHEGNAAAAQAKLVGEMLDEIERLRAENDHVTLLYNASLKSQDKQQAEIERLEKRLEVYATDGTRLSESCDGIACRDETIRLQDRRIAKLEKVLDAADQFMRGFPHFYASDASDLIGAIAACYSTESVQEQGND